MSLIVQKYGGTSIGSIERINDVAAHIAGYYKKGHQLVVVVSAMGMQTDELKSLAFQLSDDPPQRELDMLLSAGERISMALLAIALNKKGIKAMSMTGSQSGILTTAIHGNAHIVEVRPKRILNALEKNFVVIVAGFQGMSAETYEITTLGRGGSDLTAVALSQSLKADSCQIYKDVDGVFNADPNETSSAKKHPTISWYDMYKYCLYGAEVLHHRAVALATKNKTNLQLLSSFDFSQTGTKVFGEPQMEDSYIIGIASQENLILGSYQFKDQKQKERILNHKKSANFKQICFENYFDGESFRCFDLVQSEKDPFGFLKDLELSSLVITNNLASVQITGVKLDLQFINIEAALIKTGVKIIYSRFADDLVTIVIEAKNLNSVQASLAEVLL